MIVNYQRAFYFLAALLPLIFPPVAKAGLILNGSFENTLGSYVNDTGFGAMLVNGPSTVIPGWTVSTNQLAWIANGNSFGPPLSASDGDMSLDLTGYNDNNSYATIEQTINVMAGVSYVLKFDLGGIEVYDPNPSVIASADGQSATFSLTATQNTLQEWKTFELVFTASSNTALISFTGTGSSSPPGKYTGLDNVSVNLAAVPEPSSLCLWAVAASGLVWRRWRHR